MICTSRPSRNEAMVLYGLICAPPSAQHSAQAPCCLASFYHAAAGSANSATPNTRQKRQAGALRGGERRPCPGHIAEKKKANPVMGLASLVR